MQFGVLASTLIYVPIRYQHVTRSFTTQAENITNKSGVMLQRSVVESRNGKQDTSTKFYFICIALNHRYKGSQRA